MFYVVFCQKANNESKSFEFCDFFSFVIIFPFIILFLCFQCIFLCTSSNGVKLTIYLNFQLSFLFCSTLFINAFAVMCAFKLEYRAKSYEMF